MRPATPRRIIKDVGRRIAELRRERGLTQEELAERHGISVGYLRRIEAGENLTVESLVRLANRLQVPVVALFETPRSRLVPRGRPRVTRQ